MTSKYEQIVAYWGEVAGFFMEDWGMAQTDEEGTLIEPLDPLTVRAMAQQKSISFAPSYAGQPCPTSYGEYGDMQAVGTYQSDAKYMADRLHRAFGMR
jgi:hypothetical protein